MPQVVKNIIRTDQHLPSTGKTKERLWRTFWEAADFSFHLHSFPQNIRWAIQLPYSSIYRLFWLSEKSYISLLKMNLKPCFCWNIGSILLQLKNYTVFIYILKITWEHDYFLLLSKPNSLEIPSLKNTFLKRFIYLK